MNASSIFLLFLAGLAWWSLLEYLLHRFVFHHFPRTLGKRHLAHHASLEERRLALAPLPSALGGSAIHALAFLGLFGTGPGLSLLAGLVAGYLAYEWVHYATHYRVPRGRILKALRRHHMIHHHAQFHARYGVTSPLWDWVFRSLPPAPGQAGAPGRGGPAAARAERKHLPS
ncbi:sterol desaturase family protein [Vulgatibacter sp.]|uniref:sterol desaturase family protein n=1 Tax=Vulgatibacter sp. TaxID=1971226 RepID=UPI0035625F24